MTDTAAESAEGIVPEIPDELGATVAPRLFDLTAGSHILKLDERFILPPFTQLDARSGAWQDRKRLWLSVVTAGDIAADEPMPDLKLNSSDGRTARTFAKAGNDDEVSRKILALTDGISIFDPVLCEMAYRWFCPPGGTVLDPFAGGSVRGIVAAVTGRHYTGIDLSATQVDANYIHNAVMVSRGVYAEEVEPTWHVGDSYEALATGSDRDGNQIDVEDGVDFVWSCPPYHDLEKYSTDPRDLSNMPWTQFVQVYQTVIMDAVSHLRDDRFCGFVVGEIRDKKGFYRNFVGATIQAFELAGARYYNEALLVSPAGTLPMRAAKQFVVSRKLGRTHQTVLIFCKGDPKKATMACQDLAAMIGAAKGMGKNLEDIIEGDEDLTGMGHG